jgi:putative ABC transport system substrate-binding protein
MNARRKLLIAIGAGAFAAPLAPFAQQRGKMVRIGLLYPTSAVEGARNIEALRRGLLDLGWVEGRNIAFEDRFADGKPEQLTAFAAELVGLNVDVIVTGSSAGALAAKKATTSIPIVMSTGGDPVAGGLVGSLARPGGNLTGVTSLIEELSAKRLELLKEAVPGLARVAVLFNPDFPDNAPSLQGLQGAARALGVQLRFVEARDPAEFDKAFAAINKARAKALMVLPDIMFTTHRVRLVERVAKLRLPAIYPLSPFMDSGGLMFYGASLPDMFLRAATYVDKILKGAKPSDLPVEQATKFELIINLKTAKALGIGIPRKLVLRADRVIE